MANKFQKPWFKENEKRANTINSPISFNQEPICGYHGFGFYFSKQEDEKKLQQIIANVAELEYFIKRHPNFFPINSSEIKMSFNIDYKWITSERSSLSPESKSLLDNDVKLFLNCFGLALHQCIIQELRSKQASTKIGVIRARLINYQEIQQLKHIRACNYDKLISLKGTVIKVANAKITYKRLAFQCDKCNSIQIIKQPDNIFSLPNKCLTPSCRSLQFKPLYNSSYSSSVSVQMIKIQELIGSEEFENGRVPRTLECELSEDLVNICVPGDDITITGVIKIRSNIEGPQKTKHNTGYLLYLDTISIVNNKKQIIDNNGSLERLTFHVTDYYAIQKIHSEPKLFRLLVHSICPQIYGYEFVKAGLLLSLFGGCIDGNAKRAESHILIVGDPGLGKSQLLHACVNVAPRGVYVCGGTCTGSGLTVTLTKESNGECAIEAGALKLADQGCCCIDEFDKMPEQHASLLEVMEQQTISIAKAGILCSLPTRATIIAAANPAGGHYNKAKTVSENLKINSPVLSRFDLIFILLDQPNEQTDSMLSKHIFAIHSRNNSYSKNISVTKSTGNCDNRSLKSRLSLESEEVDNIPHTLLRKYIAYAQKYVHPKLSDEAKQTLKEFYIKLRREYQNGNTTPITTRQLNSLIRLTQARAKMELREVANKQDADDVIELMKMTLVDIFTDGVGNLDTTRTQQGVGMSTKKQIMNLLKHMQQKSNSNSKSIFTIEEIKVISAESGIADNKLYNVLESLNIQGFIMKKGGNRYQLVSVDF